ncbi:MAG: tRNA epoxyqueuosine(34) reductase QueG [Mariprofundales bacterium]
MPATTLTKDVKRLVHQAGFDYCGITRPQVSPRDIAALKRWLAKAMHADMAWMAEPIRLARRCDPASMLAAVRSVIAVGMRYTPPLAASDSGANGSRGVIASYAMGDDYHSVMKKRLKRLARSLDQRLGKHDQRVFVDTAPVLEHALAASGGVGWQGKHSLTLNRDGGSWMLLGELFTTVELAPDVPAINHCGSCVSCIDHCPTQAIVAPFVVDARRCISWLTIEYDGVIPRDLRLLMAGHIFGCDDCQTVCPWNQKAPPVQSDLLHSRPEEGSPLLQDILTLDQAAFHARFRATPVKRSGRTRLLRNACVAAGNSGDVALIPCLIDLLADPSFLIRLHAVWALAQLRNGTSNSMVEAAFAILRSKERDQQVLDELIVATTGVLNHDN